MVVVHGSFEEIELGEGRHRLMWATASPHRSPSVRELSGCLDGAPLVHACGKQMRSKGIAAMGLT
ncbi:hypothetical protein E2562_031436, partial [Oryza meyeriana var. granulata]